MVEAQDHYPLLIDLAEHDGRVVVRVAGRLDWSTVVEFDQMMRDLSSQWDGSQVTLDLTDVDFIDLNGVDALVRAGYRARSAAPITLRPPAVGSHVLDVGVVANSFVIDLAEAPDRR